MLPPVVNGAAGGACSIMHGAPASRRVLDSARSRRRSVSPSTMAAWMGLSMIRPTTIEQSGGTGKDLQCDE